MTCTEFHKVLPYIIDSDLTAEEHAHLDSCRVCNDVVADLKHIAQSATRLVSFEEPPARVGTNFVAGWNSKPLDARPTKCRLSYLRPRYRPSNGEKISTSPSYLDRIGCYPYLHTAPVRPLAA